MASFYTRKKLATLKITILPKYHNIPTLFSDLAPAAVSIVVDYIWIILFLYYFLQTESRHIRLIVFLVIYKGRSVSRGNSLYKWLWIEVDTTPSSLLVAYEGTFYKNKLCVCDLTNKKWALNIPCWWLVIFLKINDLKKLIN